MILYLGRPSLEVKNAILRRYDITEESYRQRFQALMPKTGETCQEVEARLRDLAAKWMKDCTSTEDGPTTSTEDYGCLSGH